MKAFQATCHKTVRINKGFGFYPSDNLRFQNVYGICVLKKSGVYYLGRIHTPRDVMFDEENIALLSEGVCKIVNVYRK